MNEFELIRGYFSGLGATRDDVCLGIGDDAAVLAPAPGRELVITSDTLIAGRHFPVDTAAADIGWKSLAVNLSDLAAMGADPQWFLLALSLPEADADWLAGYARGLSALAQQHGLALVGGDTTRGPLSITITALGSVPAGTALRRDGAQVGDVVCVTGTLGDAALALQLGSAAEAPLRARLDRPEPHVAAGLALRGLATAAIDLSDGLFADLGHICAASGVGAELELERLPASDALRSHYPSPLSRLPYVSAGDDYELCVCLPPSAVDRAAAALDLPLTVIGRISAEPGLRLRDGDGALLSLPSAGYVHF